MDQDIMPVSPYYESAPSPDTVCRIKVTFDDFLPYAYDLNVFRYTLRNREPVESDIKEACTMIIKKSDHTTLPVSFTFSLCDHPNLDLDFKVPSYVKNIDSFTKCWIGKEASNYLRSRSKMFEGYQRKYDSGPFTVYGGMSKWIKVVVGKPVIILYKPTRRNKFFTSNLDTRIPFKPEKGTKAHTYTLQDDALLVIPAGWILRIKSDRVSFVMTGEFLDIRCPSNQIAYFERDVQDYDCRYAEERDREIRTLYWLIAAKLAQPDSLDLPSAPDKRQIKSLTEALKDWTKVSKLPHFSSPSGLDTISILEALKSLHRSTPKLEPKPAAG